MLFEEFQQAIKDRGYGNENYCIYKLTFGEFGEYIGKTEKNSISLRYKILRNISSKNVKNAIENCFISDFKIEIIYRNVDTNKLREKEIELISQLDPSRKINIHKGGKIWDNKIPRKFQNLLTGEIVEKACCDMTKQYSAGRTGFYNLAIGLIKTYYNWCLPENYEKLTNQGRETTKRVWFKRIEDSLTEYLGATEMSKKYGGNSSGYSAVINGKHSSNIGWCLLENYENLKKSGKGLGKRTTKRYKFKRVYDGLEEYLGATEMSKKYGGLQGDFSAVANKRQQSCKGWFLID